MQYGTGDLPWTPFLYSLDDLQSRLFAIAFLQSAADKWLDSRGNLEYLTGHFANSPLRATVSPMFWAITVLESLAGVLCGLGALQVLFGLGTIVALIGLVFGHYFSPVPVFWTTSR